ncbi:MAG: thiamine pyrophosphate-dependent dehydrogenase E1 component subunit alpha [Planctomycetota bacterium]|nr:thiamine pyrophosphate-dependent dehydrogenase E1 component subunit alpha [Planctomycetota bacterium]
MELDRDKLLWMYDKMRLIRDFENQLHQDFAAGKIPGFVHLYAGEEAVAVGVCANLLATDYITSTHRGHGHCIAKGVCVKEMMAEIRGKQTGCCKGKGGSMHIADIDQGMLGANGIVGGGPPLACGAALTAQVKSLDHVCVCFFGDGAANQGTTAESLNLASVWKLPVIFVCENNGYAETTSVDYSIGGQDIAARGSAFGMPGVAVDGLDPFAVFEAASQAVQRAREGKGPTLLECQTYRYYGHFEGDALKYRTRDEEDSYKQRDCLELFRNTVVKQGKLNEAELNEIDERSRESIAEAVTFAEESPLPPLEECTDDVYVTY